MVSSDVTFSWFLSRGLWIYWISQTFLKIWFFPVGSGTKCSSLSELFLPFLRRFHSITVLLGNRCESCIDVSILLPYLVLNNTCYNCDILQLRWVIVICCSSFCSILVSKGYSGSRIFYFIFPQYMLQFPPSPLPHASSSSSLPVSSPPLPPASSLFPVIFTYAQMWNI